MEPVIGHMKNDGRPGRNFLRGEEGDRLKAVLSAVGQNPRLLIGFIVGIFCQFLENRPFCRIIPAFFRFSPARAA
jgi:IS5 family transposase